MVGPNSLASVSCAEDTVSALCERPTFPGTDQYTVNHDDYVSKYKTSNYSEADLIAATVSG